MTTIKKREKAEKKSDYLLVLLKLPRLFDFRSSFSNRFYQYDSHNTMLSFTTIPSN